jgi:Tol biopolymer transport system component
MTVDGQDLRSVYSNAWAADWSPDGQEIVVGDLLAGTVVVLGSDEDQREVARFQGLRPQDVSWSPDGGMIAVTTTPYDNRDVATALHIVTLGTGDVETVVEDQGWIMRPSWSPDSHLLLFTMGETAEPEEGVNIPDANMWLYDVEHNELERLTDEMGFAGLGAWSPIVP